MSILLFSDLNRGVWHGLIPTNALLGAYDVLKDHIGQEPSLAFATATGVVITYLLRFPITASQLQSLETRISGFDLPVGYNASLIPSTASPMRIPSSWEQVDTQTLEPAGFTGYETLLPVRRLLGGPVKRSNRALPLAGLTPEHALAIDRLVESYETFEHQNDPRRRIRRFLTDLLLWKQYQDEIQNRPRALKELDERYLNYRRLREQGLYPLPRTLVERWNGSSPTKLMRWLISIGIIEPVITPLKGVQCTYYRIVLPTQAIMQTSAPHIRAVQGIKELLSSGWSRQDLCRRLRVSIRTLDHWLSGTRNMNMKHFRILTNLIEGRGKAGKPTVQSGHHLPFNPSITVLLYKGSLKHVLPLLQLGVTPVVFSGYSLPLNGTAILIDYLTASDVNVLTSAMAQGSFSTIVVLSKEMDRSVIAQSNILIKDVRRPRGLAMHLALLHHYDLTDMRMKSLLADASLLGAREVTKLVASNPGSWSFKGKKTAYGLLHKAVLSAIQGERREILNLIRFYGRRRAILMVRRFLIVCLRVWRGREHSMSPSYGIYVLAQRVALMMDATQIRSLYAKVKRLGSRSCSSE
ncbi:MAG: hypothetical protein K1X70_11855 [Leptospirales bacterium]|nr:hypothetical protein [Leptospirales bacterium]